ncbi:PLP-dependent transferase, partial [Acinetobacter baumannii]
GTETLIAKTLANLGMKAVGFADGVDPTSVRAAAAEAQALGPVSVIMIETPSNPLNTLVDIRLVSTVADEIAAGQGGRRPMVIVDNTLL